MKAPHKPTILNAWCLIRVAAAILGGLAHLAFVTGPARAQLAPIEGERVREVKVTDQTGRNVAEKQPPLTIEPGEPFDFASERESLRRLYRTGDYSDVRVMASHQAGGLLVEFIVRRNYYNNVVRVEGLKEPPGEPAALAALRLGLGEPFRESSLREAVGRLQEVLRDDGFYLAKITWELTPHEDTRQMDITIHVDPGPRARVGDFVAENHTPYSDRELLRRSKISGKSELTQPRLSRDAQRIKDYLVNQGYLGAEAVITPGTYDQQTNRVPLTLAVTAGPRVRVEADGARLSKPKLRKLLPIYAEGAVDEDLLQEGRRNIRDYFERQGYFEADVQVSSHEDPSSGERVIAYEISRGARSRLAGISFNGNKYFSTDLLMSRLQLQPASFASSGHFSQQLLHADDESIRALYLSNGFRDAQVTSGVNDTYRGKKGNLFVSFQIVEGEQSQVAALQVEGNHAISTSALLAVIGSTPGQPYSESEVASDRNNVLAIYYEEGFPEAHFQEEVSPGDSPNRVKLTYRLTEGTKISVSKVLTTGYQYTRPGIIARQIHIEPGGPLREGDVVDTQRGLYNLGVFNRVQIAPQNPNGSDPDKTEVVEVHEGKRYTIGYGGGFEIQRLAGGSTNPNGTILSASPRGIFEISRLNMFGRAQTATFKVRASAFQYRALLGYTADNFLTRKDLSLQLTGFADKTQDVNTFTSIRYEAALQLVETLSPSSSLLYRYFYRHVKAIDINQTINPLQIPLLSQPTQVSGFGITYARDRRDNPADAKRGTFNTADVSIAATSLGSSSSFFRGFFQNSSFDTFGRAFVFARSTRFGVEVPLGNTNELDIPLPERFFAGGGTSLRGFGLNQAGPRDPSTGFPIGGLALLAFNQELRFPMKLPFVGNRLGGTAFYDAGNVFSDVNHISLARKPSSLSNLNYFSHTVGFGVRYPTPIGPVRVDLGYQLNPPQYLATNTPPNLPQTFRLPHFQFFFNIGSIF
jgi:outer membrane protein assembly complex protein YaeT